MLTKRQITTERCCNVKEGRNISQLEDAIIYDRDASPHIESPGGLVMFPPEVCAAVGEAKSDLDATQAKEAIEKLAEIKKIRNKMQISGFPVAPSATVAQEHYMCFTAPRAEGLLETDYASLMYEPQKCEHQALVTFLVFAEFDVPMNGKEEVDSADFQKAIREMIQDVPPNLRPNFILSLSQGFFSYSTKVADPEGTLRDIPYPYPVRLLTGPDGVEDEPRTMAGRWLPAENDHRHIM